MSEQVYVTKRGKVYHTDRHCTWLSSTQSVAWYIGRTTHEVRGVPLATVGKRPLCRVCANGGTSPLRGPSAPGEVG